MALLAIYGAALSTLLALAKIIPEWPTITPAQVGQGGETDVVLLRVANPAKRPLFLEGNIQFRGNPLRIADARPLNVRADIMAAYEQHLRYPRTVPRLSVPAEGEALVRVSGIKEDERPRLVVFWWHRNWLLRCKLPAWVWVSGPLASMVNRGD